MNAPQLPSDHAERVERMRLSLDGLSVGDAFGQHFFVAAAVEFLIGNRLIPRPTWKWTDDTEMASAVVEVLQRCGQINRDDLADSFSRRFHRNPTRGYGATAVRILQAIGEGTPWQVASPAAFDGGGSMGNGAAMRVAPLGAYFADDYSRVVAEARASAEVTHAHPEGIAGGIAVAIAAAWAWRAGVGMERMASDLLFEVVLDHTPKGETRSGIEQASQHPLDGSPITAARLLGSGLRVTSPDTVPYTIWCAARHLDDYTEAMWATVSGLGDRDTTCAIVGGIVALSAGRASIPQEWLTAREPLSE